MRPSRIAVTVGKYAGLGTGLKLLLVSHPTEWNVLGAVVVFAATGWIDPRVLRRVVDRGPSISPPEE